jgi:hypothetical protein
MSRPISSRSSFWPCWPLCSLALAALVAAACGPGNDAADAAIPEPDAIIADSGICGDHTQTFPILPSPHVAMDEEVDYQENPPSSGPHDARWARWQETYDPAMGREHWVHNLEHGGVVLLFNCPDGCPDDVAALEAVQAALPADSLCVPPITSRTLITADPKLPADVKFAAVAWGHVYTASCVDPVTLRAFILERRGRGAEATCAEGQVP